MTQSGVEITLKGESDLMPDNVFSFHKATAVSYAVDTEDRSRIEIRMSYPGDQEEETFQMIFVLKGNVTFMKRGDLTVSRNIGAQQHNLCRLESKSTRMFMSTPEDEILCINLSTAFLKRYMLNDHPAYRTLMMSNGAEMPIALLPANMHITPEINAILQRLSHAVESAFCDQLLLESKVIELLALQISQFEKIPDHASTTAHLKKEEVERMELVRGILIRQTGELLSLRALAHLVGTNEFNLKRNFKAAFGKTVYGYLHQYKMEQAKSMLITEEMTISEIAGRVGYKHATHFTNAFKKYFGYLPNKIKAGKLALLIFVEDFSFISEYVGLLS